MHSTYRPEIDGLRTLAVVPVVLFHADIPGFSGGFVGVDIFFVISGFLITSIIWRETQEGTFSLVTFYERRARRILPALSVVLLATLAAAYVVQTPLALSGTGKEALAATLFLSNVYYAQASDYFARAADFLPLMHTWSLAVEEQFYLLWPLVLMGFAGAARRGFRATVVCVFVASLGLSAFATPRFPEASFFLLPTRAWELMIGAILALGLVPAVRSVALREIAALAGVVMLLCAILLYDESIPFPGVAALLPCLGAALILHTGGATAVGRILALPPMVFVGVVSYSFYLWHWPPLALARTVTGSAELAPALGAAIAAGSFVAAVLSWRFVERPFRDRRRIGRGAVFALSAASAAGLFAVSASAVVTGGFPSRFDAVALAVEQDARVAADGREFCDGRRPHDGLCRIGNLEKTPRVLLWGDSHAGAMLAAADAALTAAGEAGVAAIHNACLPVPGLRRASEYGGCVAFKDEVLAMVEAPGSSIDTVLVAARWALAVTGKRMKGEAGAPVDQESRDGTPGTNEELFRREFVRFVDRLTRRGVRVVIVGGVPEIGWNVAERTLMETRLDLPDVSAPTLADVAQRNQAADSIFAEMARRDEVDFVPIAPLLCTPICATVAEGRPLYGDDDHISFHGAASVIAPALVRALFPDAVLPRGTTPLRTERRPLFVAAITTAANSSHGGRQP